LGRKGDEGIHLRREGGCPEGKKRGEKKPCGGTRRSTWIPWNAAKGRGNGGICLSIGKEVRRQGNGKL